MGGETGEQHQPSDKESSEGVAGEPETGGETDPPTGPGPNVDPAAKNTTTKEGKSATKKGGKDGEGGLHWAVWAAIVVAALAAVGAVIYCVAFSGVSAEADIEAQ